MKALRVLLVDDEEDLVYTLAERLSLRGYDVQAVTSGAEAISRVAREAFHVAVVDVKMPGIGGLEVLREIKHLRPELQVLLLTGHGAGDDGQEGLKKGAFAYLYKPYRFEDLVETLNRATGWSGHE